MWLVGEEGAGEGGGGGGRGFEDLRHVDVHLSERFSVFGGGKGADLGAKVNNSYYVFSLWTATSCGTWAIRASARSWKEVSAPVCT